MEERNIDEQALRQLFDRYDNVNANDIFLEKQLVELSSYSNKRKDLELKLKSITSRKIDGNKQDENQKSFKVISKKELSPYKLYKYPTWSRDLVHKVKLIRALSRNVESFINAKFLKDRINNYSIRNELIFYADPNMPTVTSKMFIKSKSDNRMLPVTINIPLDKFIRMSALEIYSLLSASTYSAVSANLHNKNNEHSVIDLDESQKDDLSIQELSKDIKEEGNDLEVREKASKVLSVYIEEFLTSHENVFGADYNNFDNISKLIASQIVNEMPGESVEQILSIFFNFGTVEKDVINKVAEFVDRDPAEYRKQLLKYRKDEAYEKSKELWTDVDNHPEKALGATKQFESLMSDCLQNQFAKIAGSSVSANGDIRDFCVNYATTFLASNAIKPIDITFKNEGALGEFIDSGSKQSININLSRIKSVTELVSTLSHELTHVVDASINKGNNRTTKEGFGLLDNISNDISSTSFVKGSKEFEFLAKINKYCYRINPNERHARYGELSALKFMSKLADDDKSKEQLFDTIERFKAYQTQTLDILKFLSDKNEIASLKQQADEILSRNIPDSDKELIRERIAYINEIMSKQNELMKSIEQKSLEDEIIKKNKLNENAELVNKLSEFAGPQM